MAAPRPPASPRLLADYQRVLDDVYQQARELIPAAPTWQAGLYQSVRACYTAMRSHPEALQAHFVDTIHDPEIRTIRAAHRERLLDLLEDTRSDTPPLIHAELLLSMIHTDLRRQILDQAEPPDLDEAEHTFASLLFHYTAITH